MNEKDISNRRWKDIQNIIKAFLENADYKVETADDGLEGINLIQKIVMIWCY